MRLVSRSKKGLNLRVFFDGLSLVSSTRAAVYLPLAQDSESQNALPSIQSLD